MKQTLIALAASAAIATVSTSAFACGGPDKTAWQAVSQGTIQLAQASGQGGGQGQQNDVDKKLMGKKGDENANGAAATPAVSPPAGDKDATDASQSKRKGTEDPAQSGSK